MTCMNPPSFSSHSQPAASQHNFTTFTRYLTRFSPCIPGRSPVSAALRPLSLLSRPAEARMPVLPVVSRLRVAAHASVPVSAGVQRGSAAQTDARSVRLRLRHLPVQQRTRAVSQTTDIISQILSFHSETNPAPKPSG